MKKKAVALKNNDSLTLILGSKHYSFVGERVDEIYNHYLTYKKNPTDENYNLIEEAVRPITKIVRYGFLEEDVDGNIFLKDTNIPIPDILAKVIMKLLSENASDIVISPYVKFWKLCLLNPNKEARDKFFQFCLDFGITITDNGYAVLYKSVQDVTPPDRLFKFVNNEYLRIKRNKKSPKNYTVYEDEEGNLCSSTSAVITYTKMHGTVHDLFNEFDDSAEFTSHHPGPYGGSIKLGEPVTMPREECDPDINVSCSYGLHVGAKAYVKSFASGSTVLACLVNPMDIVALPQSDHSKLRVCRYFPYTIMDIEDGVFKEISDESYWEDDFIDYDEEVLEDMIFDLETSDTKEDKEILHIAKDVYQTL